jgi:cobalamin biosynthesis protein CobW
MSIKSAAKIPATVLTGFLGAGKTTLIRHLLEHADRRIALIINEFGDVGIDRELITGCGIASCREADVLELANGCICCTVADEFLPTMRRLLEREEAPEHIVIETSGLALPKPLVKAFGWPEVRNRVTVDGVIAVIDAEATAAGLFATDPEALTRAREANPSIDHESPLEELFEEQIQCADMIVLNKLDLVDDAGRARAEAEVRKQLRKAVRIVPARHGALDPAVLLGLGSAAEDDLDTRPSHVDGQPEHDHDDFETFVVELAPSEDPAEVEARVRAALQDFRILRLKGFLAVDGKPMRYVVQAVGQRLAGYYDRRWSVGEVKRSTLVVIGERGLDRAGIERALRHPAERVV